MFGASGNESKSRLRRVQLAGTFEESGQHIGRSVTCFPGSQVQDFMLQGKVSTSTPSAAPVLASCNSILAMACHAHVPKHPHAADVAGIAQDQPVSDSLELGSHL